jgi:ABC-type branched-subunit amino acid transport system ATPase component
VDVAAVVRQLAAHDVAEPFHRRQRGVRRRFHHARLAAQRTLRQSVALPQYAQERPVAEQHVVAREPQLQRANERARRVLDEMGEAVVRHRLAPVAQDDLCVVGLGSRDVARRGLRSARMPASITAHRRVTATPT